MTHNWNYKGVEIKVGANGEFRAKREDLEFRNNTLAGIKRDIDVTLKTFPGGKPQLRLAVVGITQSIKPWGAVDKEKSKVCPAILTGVNRTTRALMFERLPKETELVNVLPDTPGNRELLERALAAKELMEVIRNTELDGGEGYGRIAPEEYAAALDKVRKKYERSMKEESS